MEIIKTWIKNAFIAFSILIVFLMIMVMPARSAIVITDITVAEFNTLISTHDAAWSVVYRGGSTGTTGNVEEIRLSRNISIPEAGGGPNTLIGNLVWSRPTEILFDIDEAGNLSARAGSTTVSGPGFTVTSPFNQILIFVYDESTGGASDLQDIQLNGFDVRNMFADGTPGMGAQADIVSIYNFGSQAPFSFIANWDPGTNPNSNDQFVWMVGLQNPVIPEPSTLLLVSFILFFLLRRKK